MLILENDFGVMKKAPVGFSWTVFFFGSLVPLFRGDLKGFLVMFLSMAILAVTTYGFGSALLGIIFAFKYNEWYLDDLKSKGYSVRNRQ